MSLEERNQSRLNAVETAATALTTRVNLVEASGYIENAKVAAPADASLAAGQFALWLDATDAAGKLKVKAKTADGTVVTGEVVLS